jgi:PAS domain S-box-containing protein
METPAGRQNVGKTVGLRERHFRTLVENSPDLITRFDRECRTLYANPAAVKALGAQTGALLGTTHRGLGLPENMVASSEATIRRVFETGEEQVFEMAVPGPEGMKHYLARSVPEYGEDGVIESALVIHRDITAHKTAETALRESEQHYQELFTAAGRQAQEIELLDRVRTALAGELELPVVFRTVVEGTAAAFGYTQVSIYLLQGDVLKCQHQVGYAHIVEEIPITRGISGRVVRTGEAALVENVRADPDFIGAIEGIVSEVCIPLRDRGMVVGTFNVESTGGVTMGDADLRLMTALGENVSIAISKARLYSAARASEERYRQLVETLGEGITIVDPQEKVLLANPAAESIFGVPRGALAGRNLREFLSEKEYARIRTESGRRRHGESTTYEIEISRPDGGTRLIQVTATPHNDENGAFAGTFGTLHDITEARKTEEALQRIEDRLAQAQKMEAVGRLAGGIAHDFNNLLTVISGYAGLIDEGLKSSHPIKPDIGQIRKAAERAADLTAQLLAFSRKQVLQPRIMELNEIVAGMETMLRRVIGEDIELVTSLRPDTGNVKADKGQIEQVIINLAANARDAMPAGGKLTIVTDNRSLGDSQSREHPELLPGEYVMLAVRDTGVGMSAETLSRIFEPFFTTKEVGKGTGLGLAMVYGIVKQSGGYVYCESAVGAGSTFTMLFPRVREMLSAGLENVEARAPLGGDETILLAEDEEAVRRFTRAILERHGYRVIEAASGADALAALSGAQCGIQLLLSDVIMPQMSGPDLGRKVKKICPDARILYMSGYAESSIVHRGILDAEVSLLQKPFDAATLLGKVREVLDR